MKYIQHATTFFSLIQDMWLIIGITFLLLFIGHYTMGALFHVYDGEIDGRASSPVYENFLDKNNFWKEHRKTFSTHFEPYYHWRRNGFVGKYSNVSINGIRLTPNEGIRAGAKKIFMFGGSTLWGTGSPDSQTIPSFLQAQLGNAAAVYNFGESGYVSGQELNYLLYQLSIGNTPDVVIFYDGVNDGYAGAYSPAIPRDVQDLRERRKRDKESLFIRIASMLYDESSYQRLVNYLQARVFRVTESSESWDDKIEKNIERNSALVLDMYEAHIRQVQALAKEYKFRVYFFWQPNLFNLTREINSFEESIIENAASKLVRSQNEVYKHARKRLSNREDEDIYFLGDVFDGVSQPIYIDWMHVGPDGNKIVAEEMFRKIGASFEL